MHGASRIVVDTNVFISAIMLPLSIPRRALNKALDTGILLVSDATLDELAEVLLRPKFHAYVSAEECALFLGHLRRTAELVPIVQLVRECRDPKDDKFLELAVNGSANLILTGDTDLLMMHPWRTIEILAPKQYLEI